MSLSVERAPRNDIELWELVRTLWGVEIPRVACCEGHSAPFEAFADAYFARHEVAVWKASRGLGGKSFLLALLAITEMVTLRANVTVLGGSGEQSENVHNYMITHWSKPFAPTDLLRTDPAKKETKLQYGNTCRALMASQTSVRGPHPERLRLDEVDEMKWDIFKAALGQPMSRNGVDSHTVCSSTHQYTDGTMTKVLQMAGERGWPVFFWCYRENMQSWLTEREVERTQARVPALMWQVEYELGEPSPEGRAIQTEAVEAMYEPNMGRYDGKAGEKIVIEEPVAGVLYCTGADWARDVDWTIIETRRADTWELVAWERQGRKPYPMMIKAFNDRVREYRGTGCHDMTGLGKVVDDYIEVPDGCQIEGVWLAGKVRAEMFTDYITAIEAGDFRGPRIEYAFNEHKYVTLGDLFRAGHPPDSFVAGAMTWQARMLAVSAGEVEASIQRVFSRFGLRAAGREYRDPRGEEPENGRGAADSNGAGRCSHENARTVETALDVTEEHCLACGSMNKGWGWFHPGDDRVRRAGGGAR